MTDVAVSLEQKDDSKTDKATESAANLESKREQSRISFAYRSLNEAIEIAKAVHEMGGSSCEPEQAAANMHQSPTSSGFRGQIATARVFGLLVPGQGRLTLTPLGSRIVDASQEKSARVDAFLNVPLYKQIYEKYKGNQLPPPTGLEAELVALGVASKQKERARQILQKSAQEAGFFQFGSNRLVLPNVAKSSVASQPSPAGEENKDEDEERGERPDRNKRRQSDKDRHPMIEGLLRTLPDPENNPQWDLQSRRKWLLAASSIFDVLYTDTDEGRGSLKIDIEKGSR